MTFFSTHPAIEREVNRLLPIAALLRDEVNNEVSINSGGRIYYDNGSGYPQFAGFTIPEIALRAAIRLLAAAAGQYIDPNAPLIDLELACGGRLHASLPPASPEPQTSIRLHYGMGRPLNDFATAEQIAVIRAHIAARKTIIIGGSTSSGKSTMANAIVNELVPWDARIVLIEDVFELRPEPTRNVVRRLVTKAIDTKAHVKASLRLRPDWLLIGETRDHSAWDLMDAAKTGHPGLSTVHAKSAAGVLTRLRSLAGCDDEFVREAVDLVCFVSRMPDGRRTITQILEVR